jgi:hypothetical protein
MDKVVRQSLGQFGKHLAMRPQGRKVQEALDITLRKLPPGGVLVVDFDGVEMMDYSFSDEALGTLYSRMAAKEYPDRYLVLAVGDDEVSTALMENVEVALNRREVAALAVPRSALAEALAADDKTSPQIVKLAKNGEDCQVIGSLPAHLIDTLRAVMERHEATVRDLADDLQLDSATACNNRVARLYQLHLVRREAAIVPEGGRQYCYLSVV